ncbi:MAG: MBL fold metallo-hydrolase [Myxococcales bacterium]|nr:MBL fold metallo-hydrolase [Myxococcota bacterium]MDW8281387.1 MBL fold metallo-hydrolase [Myxococcales bacterium]
MEVTFYGVRGSIPAPGPETVRYGGNTACVAVRGCGGELLILDMGTGVIGLGRSLLQSEFCRGEGRAAILLSHAHWDHIQGFPFFPPIFVPGNRFTVFGPARSSAMLEGILEGQMNPHFSPLYTMRNLGAVFEFVPVEGEVDDEPLRYGDIHIRCRANPHGNTFCIAYRLEEGDRSLVYAPDVGYPPEGPSAATLALYRGADVLIHDATYTPQDRQRRLSRGYASYADAAEAAVRAGVRRLVLFHFDQDYTDEQVDHIWTQCRELLDRLGGQDIELMAAAEGLQLSV